MIPFKEFVTGPAGFPSLLNYFAFIEEGVLLNWDGSLTASFYYRGPDMDSSLGGEEDSLAAQVNEIFRHMFGTGWVMNVDLIRIPSLEYPQKNFFNNATSLLIEHHRRAEYNKEGEHYINVFVLSLTYIPSILDHRKLKQFLTKGGHPVSGDELLLAAEAFNKKLEEFQSYMANRIKIRRMSSNDMMTYLHKCISGGDDKRIIPEVPVYIGHYLSHDYVSGLRPRIEDRYIQTVAIIGFPFENYSGILNILADLPFEYRFATRFVFLDQVDAKAVLVKHQNMFSTMVYDLFQLMGAGIGYDPRNNPNAANRAVLSDIEEIRQATTAVERSQASYGFYTSSIVLMDKDETKLVEKAEFIRKVLNNDGFNAVIETFNQDEAFLGSLPGETVKNVRRPLISTRNLSNMLPLTDAWSGLELNPCQYYPPDSPPLFYAATTGTTPFRFNLHVNDVGHTLILGPTGQGKSVLISHIANNALRYEGARVIIFDKGYSQFALTHAVGGAFFDILGEENSPSFCPLGRLEEKSEQVWATGFIERMLSLQGLKIDPRMRSIISQAVRDTAKSPSKTFFDLYLNIQSKELKEGLNPFTEATRGYLASLLDAEKDSCSDSFWQTYEISNLMNLDHRVSTPVLLYLFHRIERSFDGKPTFIIIDEGWLIMMHEVFMSYWVEFLRTARKNNAVVVFATQSLADIVQSKCFSIINESCVSKIFLPNPSAKSPDSVELYRSFGLNDQQISIIAAATGKKHYYTTARDVGERLIDLGLSPIELAFYGIGSSSDRKLISELIREHKTLWVAVWLRQKGLMKEAEGWSKF